MSAETKLGLLGLVDHAVVGGWSHVRACEVLEVADVRVHRWRARLREHGSLEDRAPVGSVVHRILAWEEQAILELIEQWGWVDRSHRKLAHRGSYTGTVFVSPVDAVARRAQAPGRRCRANRSGRGRPSRRCPKLPWERNRIWIWDASHFPRARAGRLRDRRRRYALLDRLPAH